jgi:hypothetical protein
VELSNSITSAYFQHVVEMSYSITSAYFSMLWRCPTALTSEYFQHVVEMSNSITSAGALNYTVRKPLGVAGQKML